MVKIKKPCVIDWLSMNAWFLLLYLNLLFTPYDNIVVIVEFLQECAAFAVYRHDHMAGDMVKIKSGMLQEIHEQISGAIRLSGQVHRCVV